jgi:hypothetical protein
MKHEKCNYGYETHTLLLPWDFYLDVRLSYAF